MSSHRRVVRTNSGDSVIPSQVTPPLPTSASPGFFMKLCSFSWTVIRIIWYWFERLFFVVFTLVVATWLAWWLSQTPSLYRDWSVDQSVLASVTFSGNLVTVSNARDFQYRSTTDYTPGYYTRTYDTSEIEWVHYIIEPFSTFDGPAHTMVSFTFSWGIHLVVSAEIRREKGESFDAIRWLMNQYEIVYILGSENDLIKLRTNYRKDEVIMYPIDTPKEKIQGLFLSMMHRADKLTREGEFYNTLWNTCTTNILMHVNRLREVPIRWNANILLPSHSDEMVYAAGLIDTARSLQDARAYYRVDELARSATGLIDYSKLIRKPIK